MSKEIQIDQTAFSGCRALKEIKLYRNTNIFEKTGFRLNVGSSNNPFHESSIELVGHTRKADQDAFVDCPAKIVLK